MLGSCFAENIGKKLIECGFNVVMNPMGILYNPISIHNALTRIIENREFTEDELFYHNGLWASFMHHGSFSHSDKNEALKMMNERLHEGHEQLKNATHLIITFGSAEVYEHNNNVVSNCHKLPAREFTHRLLSMEEIVALNFQLSSFNPQLSTLFTISPVRYMGEGAHHGQINKSTLLLATDQICQEMEAELKKVMSNYKDSVLIEEINVVENVGEGVKYNKAAIKKYDVSLVPTIVFLDKEGKMPRIKGTLLADSLATIFGSLFGVSTTTTFVESATGVAEGGRTGLTALTTGILFAVSIFLAPVFTAIPACATAPALIIVGFYMMASVLEIDFNDLTEAIPAFICIIAMPFLYSIAEGISLGVISYVVINLVSGKAKEKRINILMYVLAALFLVNYASSVIF